MQPRLTRLSVAVLAVAGFLAAAPRASAELLTLQLTNSVTGTVGVSLNGTSGNVTPGPFQWTDINDPTNPNFTSPITTFCSELTTTDSAPKVGDVLTFAVLPIDQIPTLRTGNDVNAIKALYGTYYFPNAAAWSAPNFAGSNESKAFQLAVWELLYESNTTKTVSSGDFSSGSSVAGLANTMLADVTSTAGLASGLSAYNSSGYEIVSLVAPAPGAIKPTAGQDQIAVRPKGVPAPPAVLLAGVGALALLGRARWNRRTA